VLLDIGHPDVGDDLLDQPPVLVDPRRLDTQEPAETVVAAGGVAEDLGQVLDDLVAAAGRRASSARRMSIRPCSILRT
jgi:hypothetical protein